MFDEALTLIEAMENIKYDVVNYNTLINYDNSQNGTLRDLEERLKYFSASVTIPYERRDVSYFVTATLQGKIIGIVSFGIYGSRQDYWAMSYISVDPSYRRLGISKGLIQKNIEWLKDHKIFEFNISALEDEGKLGKIGETYFEIGKQNGVDIKLSKLSEYDQALEKRLRNE